MATLMAGAEVATTRVQVSFKLPLVDVETLKQTAQWRDTTVTEALRGAIALDHYLRKANRDGERMFLQGSDGQIREVVLYF
jgi:hypothetical protein